MSDHNRLLALLSEPDAKAIKAHLRPAKLELGAILYESGALIERAYFPHNAMISLVVPLRRGGAIETAVVGGDGVAGASSAIDGHRGGLSSYTEEKMQAHIRESVLLTPNLERIPEHNQRKPA